jgi:hypothetical protein
MIKKTYNKIPETINVPNEFINKKGEIIFIVEDEDQHFKDKTLRDFYGSIPDFPEKAVLVECVKREDFNYTEWRNGLWEDRTVDELSSEAMEYHKAKKKV